MIATAGLDRDVTYALASRLVTGVGQLVTLGLVSILMPPAVQGYHFTFLSFIAIQSFFELGFYVVIVNIAAHEWADLTLADDRSVAGPSRRRERLASLLRFAVRWYALISSVFLIVTVIAGWLFFTAQPELGVAWKAPWTVLVAFASLQIWSNAILAFLEGCNQVAEAYRIRVIASSLSQILGWIVLACDGQLWIGPTMVGTAVVLQFCLIGFRYAAFFRSLAVRPLANNLSWRSDIWPLQWRLGIQGLSAFFFFSIFTPVAFHYHGAVAAGRVGLSWAVASGLFSAFASWPQARAPRFAILVAQHRHAELDKLFLTTLFASASTLFLILVIVWSFITSLHLAGFAVSQRFMQPPSLASFFCAALLLQISSGFSTYFRAHKQDPSTVLNLATGIVIGLAVWIAGALSGPPAMATSFLLVLALMLLPCQTVIFLRYRQRWHAPLFATK
jgi:hypothetical protein